MKPGTTIVALLTLISFYPVKTCAQSVSGVVNAYYSISAVNTGPNSVIVDNSSGLEAGELVLIIQTKGATIDVSNTAAYGNVTAINSAGAYEFNTICNVVGNQVWLKSQFLNTYDPTGQLQMVAVPAYQSVTISGAVNSTAWDSSTGKGGIVVIAATDTIFLNADIDVSGQGFQGGPLVNFPTPNYNCAATDNVNQYFLDSPATGNITAGRKGEGITAFISGEDYARGKLANGGGGGNNANSGGAGGGHYGIGGNGGTRSGESIFNCHGQFPGIGGMSIGSFGYSTGANRIFFGGGGGAGHENNAVGTPGGNGGGIILLAAPTIIGGGGRLLANGSIPINPTNTDPTEAEGDGAGGGGAGGAVILGVNTITGAVTAEANGAAGSNSSDFVNDCTGPGGGGGGGVIWTSGASLPAALSTSVSGGTNGLVVISAINTKTSCRGTADGALPGGAGLVQAGFVSPIATGDVCVVLASSVLNNFSGILSDPGALLTWTLFSSDQSASVQSFTIERSVDQIHFIPLASLAASADSTQYRYTDPSSFPGTVFYRLVWTDHQGLRSYSRIIALTRPMDPAFTFLRLRPNPASGQLSVDLFSTDNESGVAQIFNALGQQLAAYPFSLHIGTTTLTLPVSNLSPGAYFLVAMAKNRRQISSFIKKN